MAPGPGREPGGYLTLTRLIGEHRAAFAYDWRTRFSLPITAVEHDEMDICEAWLLTAQLLADPSSHVHAAVHGWAYPLSREGLMVTDRPIDESDEPASFGRTDRSQADVRAALAARGH